MWIRYWSSDVCSSDLRASFPYVPGFLGFREAPSMIEAFRGLVVQPDLIFVDGHGLSHPRGLGVASHLDLLLDRPTIGVAKTILVGGPAGPLGPEPGDRVQPVRPGRTIGMVLRTSRRAGPPYSPHRHRPTERPGVGMGKRGAE